jgi:DNA-binding PadR family transcriptional regulator
MANAPSRRTRSLPVSPAEFHILLSLVDDERHGYGIMQQVAAESDGAIRLGPGTLYGAIKRLLAFDYIREADERVDARLDDSRRKYYRLTDAGRTAVVREAERLEGLVGLARAKRIVAFPRRARGTSR